MKRRVAVLVLALSSALGTAVLASSLTVELGARAALGESRTAATVPVTVTCGPYEEQATETSSLRVSLEQSTGQSTVTGSGEVTDLVCDGSPHTYDVTVRASGGGAFRGGPATATAVAQAHAIVVITTCIEDPEGDRICNTYVAYERSDAGSDGPQEIRLVGGAD